MSKHLKLDVQIKEDDPIRNSPLAQQVEMLESNGLVCSEDELFTYSLFYEWIDEPGWRKYADFNRKVPERRSKFDDYLKLEDGNEYKTCRLKRKPVSDIVESLGVGATLSASAKLLGLTQADFTKISETSTKKTLDFERSYIASDGNRIYRTEAKGTHDGKSVHNALDSISAKKITDRHSTQDSATLIGAVLDLSFERKRSSKVILTDPPTTPPREDPVLVKLWARLDFYSKVLRTITQTAISAGFAQRLPIIKALRHDWQRVSNIPLVNPSGEDLKISWSKNGTIQLTSGQMVYGRFFGPASKPERRAAQISQDTSIFIGLLDEVIEQIAKLSLEELLRYRLLEERTTARRLFERKYPFAFQHLHILNSGVVVGYVVSTNQSDPTANQDLHQSPI